MTNLKPLDCSVAQTPAELDQVFQLRYDCYRRSGAIAPNADRRFRDPFDDLANHFSFLLRDAAEAVAATVRISVVRPDLGWTDSPVSRIYADHPRFQAIAARSYVEASRLCFDAQARRDSFVSLVAHMAALAEFYDVDWLIACPRVNHAPIYERLFGFRPLAEARRYFGVSFETRLLGIRPEELRDFVGHNRIMTGAWTRAAVRFQHSRVHAGGMVSSASSGK